MDGKLAFAGAGTHPSEAIANLAMSTRSFQLRWGRRGISKRGTGAFPLLVGCGVKPHDFDFSYRNRKRILKTYKCRAKKHISDAKYYQNVFAKIRT